MTTQLDANVKDDLKTQFVTREGTYRLLTLSEYSRPNRVGYTCNQSSPQVRVSIVTLPSSTAAGNFDNSTTTTTTALQQQQSTAITTAEGNSSNTTVNDVNSSHHQQQQQQSYGGSTGVTSSLDMRAGAGVSVMNGSNNGGLVIGGNGNGAAGDSALSCSPIYGGDRICFNFGRELHVYAFRGVKKGTEISKPIDKKCYKVTNPSCHDFNATSATPTGAPLLVGFTTGPIQLVSPHPGPREMRKLFNEERLIDKTKVTCLKWLPNSPNLFLASHASGHLYLYNEDLPCMATAPTYQPFKMGDGYTILTCKSKSTRNPLYKWVFTTENCCINEFAFSPCDSNLAIVSQDGFLRVFHYDTMELLGIARSYFGGFLCVCWSPDGKYIVVGGEDDLVTVWSLHERRVVARGQGHRSWVSVVAFDPYTTSYTSWDGGDFSDDEQQYNDYNAISSNGYEQARPNRMHSASFRSDASSVALPPDKLAITYRLGSVGQDTQICLWDITEDILRHPYSLRQRVNSLNMNDTSYMNGNLESDGVQVIRPVAIGNNSSGSFATTTAGQSASSPLKDNAIASSLENNSNSNNSSSSKFSTANCTISSHSSNANTPPDDVPVSHHNVNNKSNNKNNSSIKFPNCISATKPDSLEGNNLKNSSSTVSTSGYNSKASNSSSKSSNSSGGISAFNSLTQRLSNLSFLNNTDKRISTTCSSTSMDIGQNSSLAQRNNHRKAMSLLKSYNHHNFNNSNHNNNSNSTMEISGSTPASSSTAYSFGSLKIGGKSSTPTGTVVNSYDPMKLIGTPACPRFDDCPLLEPLVCKKIAHERLTALIFREDCFLTACQDGFIYTWARPGYSTNATQHLSPNQTAPPGGTVI